MINALEYLWVLNRNDPDRWLVSSWDGPPYWLSLVGLDARPDMDGPVPVIKKIGNGFIGQHYRFERKL